MNLLTKGVLVLFLVMLDKIACGQLNYKKGAGPHFLMPVCCGFPGVRGLTGEWDHKCPDSSWCYEGPIIGGYHSNCGGKINYTCPNGHYISQIKHGCSCSEGSLDREYEFECSGGISAGPVRGPGPNEDCYWTGWQNCFGSSFKFWVQDGYYMAGIRSEYNSSVKNWYSRIWDFYVCKL